MAMQLLKQGKPMEEAFQQLYDEFMPPAAPAPKVLKREPVSGRSFPDNISAISFPDELLMRLFSTSPKEEEMERIPTAQAP
jgi:hypothetical protein